MKYLLDTNICIFYLKGIYPKIRDKLLSKNPEDIKIPTMVKAELFYGAEKSRNRKENTEAVEKFLLPFEILPFGDAEALVYGRIRAGLEAEGVPIGPNDLIIAAAALVADGILVANNVKEFSRIPSLHIQDWTR